MPISSDLVICLHQLPPVAMGAQNIRPREKFSHAQPADLPAIFVGDGRTGDGLGDVQQFVVPAGSTRFYLGFLDGANYQGVPGQYQDNAGKLAATFEIEPERKPWGVYAMIAGIIWFGVMLALATLLLGLLYFRRRSKWQEVEPQPTD